MPAVCAVIIKTNIQVASWIAAVKEGDNVTPSRSGHLFSGLELTATRRRRHRCRAGVRRPWTMLCSIEFGLLKPGRVGLARRCEEVDGGAGLKPGVAAQL